MRPSKFEWAIAGLLFLFLFASWCFGDTTVIVGHEIDFADSLVHGDISNFYKPGYERTVNKVPGHGHASYDLPVNFALALWGIPFHIFGDDKPEIFAGNFWKILYGKSLFFLAFVIAAFLVYKICRELEVNENKSRWASFIYFTSSLAVNSVCLVGNHDALGAALTLAGILAYIRGRNREFLFWFVIAFPFKQQAAFIFLPLLLLRDKNIFRTLFKLIIVAAFTMICDLPLRNTPEAFAIKNGFLQRMLFRMILYRINFLSSRFYILYSILSDLCICMAHT